MPFQSENQKKFMFANIPEVAEKFAKKTKKLQTTKLPKKALKIEAIKRLLSKVRDD